eukprot:g44267.t1
MQCIELPLIDRWWASLRCLLHLLCRRLANPEPLELQRTLLLPQLHQHPGTSWNSIWAIVRTLEILLGLCIVFRVDFNCTFEDQDHGIAWVWLGIREKIEGLGQELIGTLLQLLKGKLLGLYGLPMEFFSDILEQYFLPGELPLSWQRESMPLLKKGDPCFLKRG